MIKTIIISHRLFSGFRVLLDLDNYDCVKDVIDFVINQLSAQFCILNLITLKKYVESGKWHFHGVRFISELKSDSRNTIYLCAHD